MSKPPLERCEECGTRGYRSRMESIDVTPENEYYPRFVYLCRSCSGGFEE